MVIYFVFIVKGASFRDHEFRSAFQNAGEAKVFAKHLSISDSVHTQVESMPFGVDRNLAQTPLDIVYDSRESV